MDAAIDERRHEFAKLGRIPALIGIDDEAGRRRRLSHRLHPFDIALAPQFQSQQRPGAIRGCHLSHLRRRIEAECESRHHRPHRADPSQVRFRAIALQSDVERLRDGMPAVIIPPVSSAGAALSPKTGRPEVK